MAKIHTDDCIPIDIYISSADLMLKQARIYYREENQEQAYLYFMKYIKYVCILWLNVKCLYRTENCVALY